MEAKRVDQRLLLSLGNAIMPTGTSCFGPIAHSLARMVSFHIDHHKLSRGSMNLIKFPQQEAVFPELLADHS